MIFKIVVDAIIRHWVVVVAATEAGTEGLSTSMQDLVVYLYADNGLVASTHPERL